MGKKDQGGGPLRPNATQLGFNPNQAVELDKRAPSCVRLAPRDSTGPTVKKYWTPTRDRLALQKIEDKTTTTGGVVIPDTAKAVESPLFWVVAAGPDCKQVKEGDKVTIAHNLMVQLINIDDIELLVVKEDEVAGIVDRPATEALANPEE